MNQSSQSSRSADLQAGFNKPESFPFRIRLLRWLGKQVWLPRGQDALLRAIHDPEAGEHFPFEIDFFGQRYRGDLAQYLDWHVFCYGGAPLCELHLLADIARFLRQDGKARVSFYDVGANIGHHSLFMAPLADDVYAFEPFLSLTSQIEAKIRLNRLTNVHIMPFALGGEDGRIAYYPGAGTNSGVGSLIQEFPGVSSDSVTVEIRNGDQLLESAQLPRIDIMKLDVQGFESNVLRGLSRRIRSDRPVIVMELSGHSRDGFGSEADFQRLLYNGAICVEVTGRNGRTYRLKNFDYGTSEEVLVLPPEYSGFLNGRL